MAQRINLQTLRDSIDKTIKNREVQPNDSASNVGSENYSRLSFRSLASSKCSTRSSASAKARAKRAIIEAEVAAIQRLCAIEEEELRLQQRKRQLELQINLAKAEAEEKAYAEPDESEMFQTLDETGPDEARVNQGPKESQVEHLIPRTEELNDRDQLEPGNLRAHKTREKISTTENQKEERRDVNLELPHTMASNPFSQYIPWNAYNQHDIQPVRNGGDLFEKLLESQDRQSYMFNQLLQRQQANINALSLPQHDLPLFDGDPTKYCDFI